MPRLYTVLIIAVLLGLSACNATTPEPMETDPPPADIVAVAGGESISRMEYEYLLAGLLSDYTTYSGAAINWDSSIDGKPAAAYFRDAALERAVTARAVTQKASGLGISLSEAEEEDIGGYIAQEIGYMGGAEAFDAYLKGLGADEATHIFYNYRLSLLSDKLFTALLDEGGSEYPDNDRLLTFFNEHFTHLSYIYFSALDKQGNLLTGDALAERRSEGENVRILAAEGRDFAGLIRSYSDDYLMLLTPQGMHVPKGQNGDAFDQAAALLNIGDISPLVDAGEGFYIILRQPDDTSWFAENQEVILYEYQTYTYNILMRQWCDEIPVTTTDIFDALHIPDYAPKG